MPLLIIISSLDALKIFSLTLILIIFTVMWILYLFFSNLPTLQLCGLIKSVINIFIDLIKVLDIVSSVLPQTQSLSTLSKTQIGCVLDFLI